MNGYIKALNMGKEVVIVSGGIFDNSAIFWKQDGIIKSFTRSFGVMERPDMTEQRFIDHIEALAREGAQFFIRGTNL